MQSAAGGTSQRLKPAFAIVCSRSRIPSPPPEILPAFSTVAIFTPPLEQPCRTYPASVTCYLRFRYSYKLLACCPAPLREHRNPKTDTEFNLRRPGMPFP